MIATNGGTARSWPAAVAFVALCALGACRRRDANPAAGAPGALQPTTPGPSHAVGDTRPVILFVGTSLTAGYGLDPDEAFPALVQREDRRGRPGLPRRQRRSERRDLRRRARRRIDWLLRQPVSVLVLETGANDGLRGQDPRPRATTSRPSWTRRGAARLRPSSCSSRWRRCRTTASSIGGTSGPSTPSSPRETSAVLVPFLLAGVAGEAGSISSTASTPTPKAPSASPTTSGRSCGRCSAVASHPRGLGGRSPPRT